MLMRPAQMHPVVRLAVPGSPREVARILDVGLGLYPGLTQLLLCL